MGRIAMASLITTASLLHGTHAENGALRLIDDRCAEQAAESAVIGDGERPVQYVFRCQALASARCARSATSFAICVSPLRSA